MIRRITLFVLPVLLSGTIAHAVTLSTPVVENTANVSCVVTNSGTKPAAVSVEMFDFTGDRLIPGQDSCATLSPLAPHTSCLVAPTNKGEAVSCVIQTSSKAVRGAVAAFDETLKLVTMVPATGN